MYMKYRADIDGLRAVAIILVLIYHGGLSYFPSGFIGVDVFFVISGFVITRIIHDSLAENRFSFIDFYSRRLWRLQPVLICFLFVTTVCTIFLFLPDDLILYGKSARKTSLFLSNLFFKKTTTGYFSPDTHQLPLLHTWSLSIEWQCYLILPIAMYGLYRFFNKRYLTAIIYSLTLLCFLLSLHYSKESPAWTYYQFSSRIFEFLIGSCVALIPANRATLNKHLINVVGLLALVGILYIAHLDHILLGYPNWYAFITCMATGLLIALGTFYPTQISAKILSFKPLVFIGLLSYSLYIWHWAVFAMLRYYSVVDTPVVLLAAYGLTVIIAYLSWKTIEKPMRQFKSIKFRYTFVSLLVVPIFLTHITSYLITSHDGFPKRFNNELQTVYNQLKQYSSTQRPLCISNERTDINTHCTIGTKKTNSKTGLLIGDSFSNHYWGFMDMLAQDAGVAIVVQGVSLCLTLPDIYLFDWWLFKNQIHQECYAQTQTYYRMIAENHYDYVIIGQLWSNYLADNVINKLGDERSLALTKHRLQNALDKALNIIVVSGAKPVLIKTTALMQKNFHDCFFKHIKLHQPYDPNQCNFDEPQSASEEWFTQLFDKMQAKYPQLIVIDPKKVQCNHGRCKADVNGIPVYRDVGHITDYASYQFGKQYLKEYNNPLIG